MSYDLLDRSAHWPLPFIIELPEQGRQPGGTTFRRARANVIVFQESKQTVMAVQHE